MAGISDGKFRRSGDLKNGASQICLRVSALGKFTQTKRTTITQNVETWPGFFTNAEAWMAISAGRRPFPRPIIDTVEYGVHSTVTQNVTLEN